MIQKQVWNIIMLLNHIIIAWVSCAISRDSVPCLMSQIKSTCSSKDSLHVRTCRSTSWNVVKCIVTCRMMFSWITGSMNQQWLKQNGRRSGGEKRWKRSSLMKWRLLAMESFIYSPCFHTHLEECTWDMSECTLSVIQLLTSSECKEERLTNWITIAWSLYRLLLLLLLQPEGIMICALRTSCSWKAT